MPEISERGWVCIAAWFAVALSSIYSDTDNGAAFWAFILTLVLFGHC